jgi:hypothetical protein
MSILKKLAVGSLAVMALLKLQKPKPDGDELPRRAKRLARTKLATTAAKLTRRKPAKAKSPAKAKPRRRAKPTV